MKKFASILIMFTLFVSLLSATTFAGTSTENTISINKDNGTVSIGVSTDYTKIKVLVRKGEEQYTYNMYSSNVTLPLQMGSGIYEIGVYDNIEGKKYKRVDYRKVNVKIDELNVFLQDVQEVAIKNSPNTVSKAEELTSLSGVNELSDMEKLNLVYDYVVNNMEYDTVKARSIGVRYIPNADQVLIEEQGICYDYASVMAVMLRSLDIPTKLDKGYTTYTKNYHAWNEVFIDGKWLIVDTTTDSSLVKEGMSTTMVKDSKDYKVKYEF